MSAHKIAHPEGRSKGGLSTELSTLVDNLVGKREKPYYRQNNQHLSKVKRRSYQHLLIDLSESPKALPGKGKGETGSRTRRPFRKTPTGHERESDRFCTAPHPVESRPFPKEGPKGRWAPAAHTLRASGMLGRTMPSESLRRAAPRGCLGASFGGNGGGTIPRGNRTKRTGGEATASLATTERNLRRNHKWRNSAEWTAHGWEVGGEPAVAGDAASAHVFTHCPRLACPPHGPHAQFALGIRAVHGSYAAPTLGLSPTLHPAHGTHRSAPPWRDLSLRVSRGRIRRVSR